MNIINPIDFFTVWAKRKTPKRLPSIIVPKISTVAVKSRRGGNAYRFTKSGYREDIDLTVRSGWEADFARILISYSIPFEYERHPFDYPVKQRRTRRYLPDYRIGTKKNYNWVELKGWPDTKSKTLLRRMRMYYPEEFEKLVLVVRNSKVSLDFCEELQVPNVLLWNDIMKLYKDKISNWESS